MNFKISIVLFLIVAAFQFRCSRERAIGEIMTVNGSIHSESLGVTLPHEHLLVDFIGADSIDETRWDDEEVIQIVLPNLLKVKESGCQTFVDCTPNFLGRDALLLKELSRRSGVQIITNTGLYGARNNKYLPEYAFHESVEELANRWVDESESGIDETGIKPGFIKIGVDEGKLSEIHQKLIKAAGITHLKTGLSIAAHTGPYEAAKEQLDILNEMGVASEAFIWVHAQAEEDLSHHVELAKRGAWISLDGVSSQSAERYINTLNNLKENGLLNRVLISQDAGWYSPGEENGGDFKDFNYLLDEFLPLMEKEGFSKEEIDQLTISNPAQALYIGLKGDSSK